MTDPKQRPEIRDLSDQSDRPANEVDRDLLLAQQLLNADQAGSTRELPDSMLAQLTPEQLEQFAQAREGLEILQRACSGSTVDQALEAPTCDHDSHNTWKETERPGSEPIPNSIGRFEIREEVGHGGFGIVLRANDPRLNRDVALKIPRAGSLLQPEMLKRFQREARAAALLSHPGIVPIFETDRIGPILYIAYEFVEGQTLSQWIREEGTIQPKSAARLAQQLAESVQYAHTRGIVHRDLKPANVLIDSSSRLESPVATDPILPRLRITDFGLADLHGDTESLTAENALVGTPSYMAPEQAEGKTATASSDLYSLGVILYEMLTGGVPFQGESHLETARMISSALPMAPHRNNPSVPRDLSAICLKCLEKTPQARYESVQEFANDLQRFVEGNPVQARHVGWFGSSIRWSRKNPILAGALAATLISMAIGTAVSAWQWRRAEHNLLQARASEIRAEQSLLQAERAIETMLIRVSENLKNVPAMSQLRQELLSDALQLQLSLTEINEAGEPSHRVARAFRRLGMIQADLGRLDEAKESFGDSLDILQQLDPNETETVWEHATVLRRLANINLLQGRPERCIELCKRSIELLKNQNPATAMQLSLWIDSQIILGRAHDAMRKTTSAIDAFENGIELADQLEAWLATEANLTDDLPDGFNLPAKQASLRNSLAIELKRIGKTEESKQNYRESIARTQLALKENPERVDLLEQLGGTSINLGNLENAARNFKQALAHYQLAVDTFQTLATRFPAIPLYELRLSSSRNGLGIAQHRTGQQQLAEKTFLEGIRFSKRNREFEPGPATTDAESRLYSSYGNLLSELDRNEDAIEQFDLALRIQMKLLDESPKNPARLFQVGLVAGNRAVVFLKQDAFTDAEEGFVQSTKFARQAMESLPQSPRYRSSLAWNLDKLVLAHCGAKQHSKSIDAAEELFQLYPKNSRRTISLLQRLKSCVDLIEKPQADSDHFVEASRIYENQMLKIMSRIIEENRNFREQLEKQNLPLSEFIKSLENKELD